MPAALSHKSCLDCAYSLDHLTTRACPECGRTFDPQDPKTFALPPHPASTLIPWAGLIFSMLIPSVAFTLITMANHVRYSNPIWPPLLLLVAVAFAVVAGLSTIMLHVDQPHAIFTILGVVLNALVLFYIASLVLQASASC